MVREVIHLQVGQCGNQIGCRFWEQIAQEHGISANGIYEGDDTIQLEKVNVFFRESRQGYMPRTLLIDTENSVLNHVRAKTYGNLYSPDSFISTDDGAANNYMRGYYSEDASELSEIVQDRLRYELEACACNQGVTFSHSSAGGTGSGLTMKLWQDTVKQVINKYACIYFFTIFPSTQISNTVTGPYNSCMTIHAQQEANNVVCFDNEALYNICLNSLGLGSPTFHSINQLVANVMSGNTANLRFPGQINTDLNKLSYSLRTTNFMHWFTPTYAPLYSTKKNNYREVTVQSLIKQMIDPDLMMCDIYPSDYDLDQILENDDEDTTSTVEANDFGRSFSYAALFRGNIFTQDVDESMTFIQPPDPVEYKVRKKLGYIPRYCATLDNAPGTETTFMQKSCRQAFNIITNYAPPGEQMTVTFLRNTSMIKFKFLKLIRESIRMSAGSAFLHWYDPAQYPGATDAPSLDDIIKHLKDDFIIKFGVQDETGIPAKRMLKKKYLFKAQMEDNEESMRRRIEEYKQVKRYDTNFRMMTRKGEKTNIQTEIVDEISSNQAQKPDQK